MDEIARATGMTCCSILFKNNYRDLAYSFSVSIAIMVWMPSR